MSVKELAVKGELSHSPSVGILAQAKKLALRRGVWFKTLKRVERDIIDLTVQCLDSNKSTKLTKLLTTIINKQQSAMASIVDRLVSAF